MPTQPTAKADFLRIAVALATVVVVDVASAQDDGLVARWQFTKANQDSATFRPMVSNLPARVHGPIEFGSSPPAALVFDGNSKAKHRVAVDLDDPELHLSRQDLTVEAWVRVDKPLEWGGIVGYIQDNGKFEKGWLLGYRNSQFCLAVSSAEKHRLTYLTSPRMFEPGFWYHVAGTYDGRRMTLFVDGKPAAVSNEQQGEIDYPPKAAFTIGAFHDDNELHALTGQIEQVAIWNRVLTPSEIDDRFKARKHRFPEIDTVHPDVTDWPTYLRDNQRTGITKDRLRFPLNVAWTYSPRHRPAPAWPSPAGQDFWHKKFNLRARVTYDRAPQVVVAGNRLYFGSSADDKVYCLDARTGATIWEFYTEGPVRLAPTVADGRVLFGSDDGRVYCLDAISGDVLWKHRAGDDDRRIPGNERVISTWPVRTGVLVEDNIAYFCAGLFPQQGVYQTALDLRTGRKLAGNQIDVSAQGYLARRAGQLFVATGRDPAGAFVSKLKRTGKGVGRELNRIANEFPFAFVGDSDVRIGGGDGTIAAFRNEDGKQVWSASVDGQAWSLAIAGERLFVGTSEGLIYSFAYGEEAAATSSRVGGEPKRIHGSSASATAAEWILDQADSELGYCLVLNSGDGSLACELAQHSRLHIVAVESDQELVHASRRFLDDAGLYGTRVSVHHLEDADRLPYTDYLFNLIVDARVVDGATAEFTDEMKRLQRPFGGVVVTGLTDRHVHRRGALAGTGEWSHMYANASNTVCSDDQRVNGRMRLQWFGRPGPQQMIDRHHRTVAPVWKHGRLFIPGNNRVIAADAYNGTQLWNVEIPDSRRIGAYRDSSYLVAADDAVYVAAGNRCLALDAATGQHRLEIAAGSPHEDSSNDWGYIAVVGNHLFGSATKPGAARRDHSLVAINEGTFWDARPLVCSDHLFVKDRRDGRDVVSYLPTHGAIVNSTITIGGNRMYFVESSDPATRDVKSGRVRPQELFAQGARLVAVDVPSGSIAWARDIDLSHIRHNIYTAFAQGKLVIAGSYNSGSDRKKDSVLYDVHVVDAETGRPMWSKTQRNDTVINGDHGEQDHHPVIAGDRVYCEPFAYDLNSGDRINDWKWNKEHRRGCGQISASSDSFFFRHSNPTLFDLKTQSYSKVTTTTRPGCWINMIPAGGLLLIPEASSGCTCNYAIQTSLAFLPEKLDK